MSALSVHWEDGLETISVVTHRQAGDCPSTHMLGYFVGRKGKVESFFTLHRKTRKAVKAAQNPPCLWEQGQRTAKWLGGSGTHLKVSLGLIVGVRTSPTKKRMVG